MRRIRSKITYANVVATLALFIALGGVSYAAVKLPKNSVGEKQIKKNAVTTKKIKKNAITGDKIKAGTIKGTDISLASLGKVPSASQADVATKSSSSSTTDQVVGVAKRVGVSFSGNVSMDNTRLNATEVPLASHGQVSIYGKCFLYSSTVYAEVYAKTSADGALVNADNNSYYGTSGYLNTSTVEGDRYIAYSSAGSNSGYGQSSNYYGIGSIFGPDGNGLNFDVHTWAKQGTISPEGNGSYGAGSVCVFNASATKLNAG